MNTVWIFDITEVLLIFLGYANGTNLSLECWGSAFHLCRKGPVRTNPQGAVEGDWKLSEQQGITSSRLLLFLFSLLLLRASL